MLVRTLAVLSLATGATSFAMGLGAIKPNTVPSPTLRMESRWTDRILDESIPDPVFDEPSPYKGRVPYGFSDYAEKLNGRASMIGFTVLYLQEAIVGKGVLAQYGLPYDAGAIVEEQAGTGVPPLAGVAIASIMFVICTIAGKSLGESGDNSGGGLSLPNPFGGEK